MLKKPGPTPGFLLILDMQFVNPLFLIALSAIIIPILIHLFNFRQFKKVYFTNVAFLREIQQETRKQSRLKQWLILLARILAIAALVVAFAQPYIPAPGGIRQNAGKKSVSVYLDNSYSMEGLATEGRMIDEAKTRAREIVAAYSPSDMFQLMTSDFEGRMHRFTNRDQFLQLLDEVNISTITRNLNEVITRQNDLKGQAGNAGMEAYLISDFQKSTHLLASARPDSAIRWFLVPVTTARKANLYIDTVFFESPVHLTGQTARLHVRIRNSGGDALEKVPVKLIINGIQKTVANFSIAPDSETSLIMPYTENSPGIRYGEISITDYPVVIDDPYYFTYRVMAAIPVLTIYDPDPNPFLQALFGNDSSILYRSVEIRQLAYSNLFSQSLIILNGVREISSGLASELNRYVNDGGHLVIFPPVSVPSPSLNSFMASLGSRGYGSPDTNRQRISNINIESDLYRDVFEKNSAGKIILPDNPDLPVINRYYSMHQSPEKVPEILLRMDNNQPFLMTQAAGKGRIYLFASACEPSQTNFPRHAIFVPTLFSMALQSQPFHPLSFHTGENVTVEIPADTLPSSEVYKVRQTGTGFEIIPAILRSGMRSFVQTHDQIRSAGLYQVMAGDREVTGIAFNYNRKESDMACFTPQELKEQAIQLNLKNMTMLGEKTRSLTRQIEDYQKGTPLWKYFIILALLFLAAEIALIRYFKTS